MPETMILPIADLLRGSARRDRRMTPEARRALGKSVEKLGQARLPVWNRRSRTVVDGRELVRRLAARGDETVKVLVVDLSPAEEKALRLVMHSPALAGTWKPDAASKMTDDVRAERPDLAEDLRLEDLRLWLLFQGAGMVPPERRAGQLQLF